MPLEWKFIRVLNTNLLDLPGPPCRWHDKQALKALPRAKIISPDINSFVFAGNWMFFGRDLTFNLIEADKLAYFFLALKARRTRKHELPRITERFTLPSSWRFYLFDQIFFNEIFVQFSRKLWWNLHFSFHNNFGLVK